jgi:hypothetical protein
MATFRLPHFSAPSILQAIDRTRLLTFLLPYRSYFLGRGLALPYPSASEDIPFDRLIRVFMAPDEETPDELIDALYYVDAMSTPQGMQVLLEAARETGLVIDGGDNVTSADVAVQVWVLNRTLLERKQAEQYLTNPRRFEYFQTDQDEPPPFAVPAPDTIVAIENDLNDWFVAHRRGRTARVFVFERPDGGWFLIRHGEPFKREETFQGVEPASVAYRPLRYDVAVYDPCAGELRVHAQLKGEKDLYCRVFGLRLFGREDFFPWDKKYTLEPLRDVGERCLNCADVDGLEWVRLRELHYFWGGTYGEYEIVKAKNVFSALRERDGRTIPVFPKLMKAGFLVKFRSAPRPRSVSIKPPNVALYDRDQDAGLVEEWLRRRGFLNASSDLDPTTDPLLAGP